MFTPLSFLVQLITRVDIYRARKKWWSVTRERVTNFTNSGHSFIRLFTHSFIHLHSAVLFREKEWAPVCPVVVVGALVLAPPLLLLLLQQPTVRNCTDRGGGGGCSGVPRSCCCCWGLINSVPAVSAAPPPLLAWLRSAAAAVLFHCFHDEDDASLLCTSAVCSSTHIHTHTYTRRHQARHWRDGGGEEGVSVPCAFLRSLRGLQHFFVCCWCCWSTSLALLRFSSVGWMLTDEKMAKQQQPSLLMIGPLLNWFPLPLDLCCFRYLSWDLLP